MLPLMLGVLIASNLLFFASLLVFFSHFGVQNQP